MPTPLKSVRIAKPYASMIRLIVGEVGIKSLTILDNGWLEIVGAAGTVVRPPQEVVEGVSEPAAVVARPEVAHVPEAHEGPVSQSVGLPAGEAGYVAEKPYRAPEPSRKRGRKG
jgi:hypothetical protein